MFSIQPYSPTRAAPAQGPYDNILAARFDSRIILRTDERVEYVDIYQGEERVEQIERTPDPRTNKLY